MDEQHMLEQPDETVGEAQQTARRRKPNGKTDPAGEAGWYLEREREQLGYSYEDIAEVTGFHPIHLEAIEYGDLTRLPNRTEAVNMIGHYAQLLGFDPQPLVMHYAKFLPRSNQPLRATHPADPAPLSSAKIMRFGRFPKFPPINIPGLQGIPGGAGGVVASCLAVLMLFGGVAYFMQPAPAKLEAGIEDTLATASTGDQPADIQSSEAAMPDPLTSTDALPAEADLAQVTEETPPTGEAAPEDDALGAFIEENVAAAAAPKKKKGEAEAVPEPQKEAAADAANVQVTANGRLFGAENENARLVLKAKAPVWVRIEDASGNVVMTQMLMKGDTYRVPDRDGLMLIARDGGLLSYEIDGKEKGVLGPPGEILVGRPLDLKEFGGKG
jgi:cytoskeleton protein RodZ